MLLVSDCLVDLPLDMLSRLKGIETCVPWQAESGSLSLWICFPVWRELKQFIRVCPCWHAFVSLDMLSRLKGIETNSWIRFGIACLGSLDMLSRLKGIETLFSLFDKTANVSALDMLSRLKGIETCYCGLRLDQSRLWICFPVWRELKQQHYHHNKSQYILWICFPVWRELKPCPTERHRATQSLWICFPVWRELKRL